MIITSDLELRVIELPVIDVLPISSKKVRRIQTLCTVRALCHFTNLTLCSRKTEQLFVCFGAQALGRAPSQQRLTHWIVEAMSDI